MNMLHYHLDHGQQGENLQKIKNIVNNLNVLPYLMEQN